VAQRANHRREYCLAPEVLFNLPFEVDHIQPTSEAGTDDPSNLVLSCRSCNLFKSATRAAWAEIDQREYDLFDLRRDRWKDHFSVDLERGEILALTGIGRVTIAVLRMNDPNQIVARLLWIELRLFP
jgi:hypothetical protein